VQYAGFEPTPLATHVRRTDTSGRTALVRARALPRNLVCIVRMFANHLFCPTLQCASL